MSDAEVERLKMLLLAIAKPIGERAMTAEDNATELTDDEVTALKAVGNDLLAAVDAAREAPQ